MLSSYKVNVHGYSSAHIDDSTSDDSLKLIVAAQQYLSLTLVLLTTLILYKFVFPSLYVKKFEYSTKEILRNSLFWGFVFSSIVGLLVMIIYDCSMIHEASNISFWWFILPIFVLFSLAFVFSLVTFFTLCFCRKKIKQCLYILFHIAVIIMTSFVFVLSYHIGWITLLLITYPLQVGTLILIIITAYIALAFFFALLVHYFKKRQNQKLSLRLLMIGFNFFITLEYFLFVYYQMLAKYPHDDSITKILSSLIPGLFIAFCTWIAKNIIFKMIDDDKEKEVSHNNEDQQSNNNENPHENEIVTPIEGNEHTPLLSGYQSTTTKRSNGSVNSNA